jgi:hypothetical protein
MFQNCSSSAYLMVGKRFFTKRRRQIPRGALVDPAARPLVLSGQVW